VHYVVKETSQCIQDTTPKVVGISEKDAQKKINMYLADLSSGQHLPSKKRSQRGCRNFDVEKYTLIHRLVLYSNLKDCG